MSEKTDKLLKDVFEKHRNNLDEWQEGLLEEDTAIIPNNKLGDFLDCIYEKIGEFGYGETYFHTADVQLMLRIIKKLEDELDSHKVNKANLEVLE